MKKLTVTIGIPAHNEAKNISRLLDSILSQEQVDYVLEKVVVVCDGCTDNTARIVREYSSQYPFITVINDQKRLGQATRLNYLYRANTSDIFVAFDADVVLKDTQVVKNLITPFSDPKVGLVGGADLPDTPTNMIQKMTTTWLSVWYEIRHDLRDGDSVHNHHNPISALRRQLAQKIQIPANIIANDDFAYFTAKKLGYQFRFAEKAIVLFQVPKTAHDFFTQTTRFLVVKHRIAKHFGSWVYEEYKIPTLRKIRALLVVFWREPLYLPLAVLFQIAQRLLKFKYIEKYSTGFWITAHPTK